MSAIILVRVIGGCLLLALAGTSGTAVALQEPQPRYATALPSTLVQNVLLQMHLDPSTDRQVLASNLEGRSETVGLPRREQYFLGELHFLLLRGGPAFDVFSQVVEQGDSDWYGRRALERMMIIYDRARNDEEGLRRTIARYERLSPDITDLSGGFWGYSGLIRRYSEAEDHVQVVQLVRSVVRRFPPEYPFRVLTLPVTTYPSFEALGLEAEAIEMIEQITAAQWRTLSAMGAVETTSADQATIFEHNPRFNWIFFRPEDIPADPGQHPNLMTRLSANISANEAFLRCQSSDLAGAC